MPLPRPSRRLCSSLGCVCHDNRHVSSFGRTKMCFIRVFQATQQTSKRHKDTARGMGHMASAESGVVAHTRATDIRLPQRKPAMFPSPGVCVWQGNVVRHCWRAHQTSLGQVRARGSHPAKDRGRPSANKEQQPSRVCGLFSPLNHPRVCTGLGLRRTGHRRPLGDRSAFGANCHLGEGERVRDAAVFHLLEVHVLRPAVLKDSVNERRLRDFLIIDDRRQVVLGVSVLVEKRAQRGLRATCECENMGTRSHHRHSDKARVPWSVGVVAPC